jgi:hypothetical protein
MTQSLLIRRSGTLVDLSPDGVSPLPPSVVDYLRPHLRYEYREFLQPHERFLPDGSRLPSPIVIEPRYLFAQEHGRLVTSFGLLPRVIRALQSAGVELRYVDISPPRARPECYTPDWDNLWQKFSPRAKQAECLAAIAAAECGQIDGVPGFGKTELITAVCYLYPRAKIHIVVRPKDVATSIMRRLSRHIPNVGMVGGGARYIGDRVTVFVAASLHHSDGDADILLGDEAELLVTDKTSDPLGRIYRNTRNFAFSATLADRFDGLDARLEMFFGPVIFRLSYQDAVAAGLVSPIIVRWLPMELEHDPAEGRDGVPQLRWGVWRHHARHAIFAADARTYPDDHQCLFSCATLEHCVYLRQHLPEYALCYAGIKDSELQMYQRSKLLPADFRPMTATLRDGMREAFSSGELKKVIATDVWLAGVDFPNLRTFYRADARASDRISTQGPGRVSRTYDGKEYGEVIDSCDFWSAAFHRKARGRRQCYNKHGWQQLWPRTGRARG